MFLTVMRRSAYGVAGAVFLVVGVATAVAVALLVAALGDEPAPFDRRTEAVVTQIARTHGGGPARAQRHVRVVYDADGRRVTARLRGGHGQGLRAGDRVEVFYRSGEPDRVATRAYAEKGPVGAGTTIVVIVSVAAMSTVSLLACRGLLAVAAGRRRSLLPGHG
ncbi:DUF3592 domain-containing protein [Streptomyces sp. TRM 70351]|uniref:DUF3592 domain-containing protein n=1 Tax=Streptomyces sp. TRM 70351 TaxID=3116552 RepID=UPI002E7AD4EA|nr:DUF3592 domain-containing protein [Streptomyces sp. TRM 70351]MEE1926772.1 DUF3592 domain-containing protein [Streptomyces sp. TRM 70351]